MDVYSKLIKDVVINVNQGYSFYFYSKNNIIERNNGVVKEENSNKISFNTNFRLASVSKQFIAFSIIDLILKGKLSFDTVVKDIYLDLPDYFHNITVKHLLNHTSGIYNYEAIPHKDDDPQILDKDILPFLKTTNNTYFEPGTTYKYSNTGYILLGLIVEEVSKQSITDYIGKNIFQKALMDESKVNIEGVTNINNRAYGHLLNDHNQLYVKDQYWCSATIGDGGLYSSVNDLKKWINFLINTPHFKLMNIPNYINKDDYNEYGYGIRIVEIDGKKIYYHSGDTIGTNTLLLFSEDLEICLIFLTNLGNINATIMKDNLLELIKTKAI